MKSLLIAAALATTVISTPVFADEDDGNQVYTECPASSKDTNHTYWSYCIGLTRGYYHGLVMMVAVNNKHVCAPTVSNAQIFDVMMTYLRTHPQQRSDDMMVIMLHAVQDAWPCA
jgi:Rap1a immunity proteins